jgi:hypothetical protein
MQKSRFSTFSLFLYGICLVAALTFLASIARAETERPFRPELNPPTGNCVRSNWPLWAGALRITSLIGSIILLSKGKTTSKNNDLPPEEDTYFG